MKTILHIIDTTGPGGAETVFIDLATRLPKDKYRSVVVIRGKGWVYQELGRRGMTPILLDAKGSFNWRYLRSLIKLIRAHKVAMIQSHLLGANVYSSLAGLFTRTPVVATFHGEVDIGARERLKSLKMGAINAGSKRIIAVSAGLREDILRRTTLHPGKLGVIYNGIDTKAFQRPRSRALRVRFGWPDDVFIVGCLGNIRPAKGYDILLRAAALLEEYSSDKLRFVVAGQPDQSGLYEQIRELQKDLGVEKEIEFLGFIEDPAEYLANLDLFLSTSISEGLPLSAIQAMSAGIPLLATRCGGYQELVTDRENGWLVDVGNPKSIADAVKTLVESPDIRAQMAQKAQMHVQETFDIKVMLERYQELYDSLISN